MNSEHKKNFKIKHDILEGQNVITFKNGKKLFYSIIIKNIQYKYFLLKSITFISK